MFWMSGALRGARQEQGETCVGAVTLEGDPAGVYLSGERRELPVFAPGGVCWTPALGQEVLVLKGGPGEGPCVVGLRCSGGTKPGELRLTSAGGASIHLKNDGTVDIQGQVTVNGLPLEEIQGGGGTGWR